MKQIRKKPTLRYSHTHFQCVLCHTTQASAYRLVQIDTRTPHLWVVCEECEPEWNDKAAKLAVLMLEKYSNEQLEALGEKGSKMIQ